VVEILYSISFYGRDRILWATRMAKDKDEESNTDCILKMADKEDSR
jgi:hypothetical protein